MNAIIQLIIGEVPNIVALIQQRHAENHPGVPPPTPQEIMDNFETVFNDTILKDQLIRAALTGHP